MGAGGMPPAMGGGADVSKMGLPAPDPNRVVDPTHHVRGTIRVHPKAKDRAPIGGSLFVIVKRDVDGKASGPPLAVDKLTLSKDDLPFEMTERQAMIGGTELTGDVVVLVRYDHDGDALSKQPGDVTGEAHVKIPADKVVVTLDTILP
jgi:hypothetical protein